MASTNEKLLDALVRHQIYLSRYSTGLYRKLLAVISKADQEVAAKIEARAGQQTFTKARLEALLADLRTLNKKLVARLAGDLEDELDDLAEYETGWTAAALQKSVPISLSLVTPAAATLHQVVVGDPIAGSLLHEQVQQWGAARERRVREALRQGVLQGETIDQMARRVRGTRAQQYRDGILDVSRRDAQAIVRTAVNNVTTQARETLYEQNTDLIKGVRWVSTLDGRTTEICRARDGKVYEPGKGPRPPAHWNCRSTTVPVTKSWAELGIDAEEAAPGTRASMNGQVPGDLTYGEWLKRQPRGFIDEVLGPKRARLFVEGGLPIDRFVDEQGETLTLAELRTKESRAWNRVFDDE